ncbi:hypothetical protein AX16_008736 [Volvariella volvacea WC 439]|nr:hypothetical protein AX16_008736 [Volvariella volvacea WC 439]
MAPAATQNHDPALSHPPPNPAPAAQPAAPAALPTNMQPDPNIANLTLPGLDQNQLMALLRHIPSVFKLAEAHQGGKEDAAQALSNLSQGQAPPFPPGHHQIPIQHPYPGQHPPPGLPGINDPGPSSHPRGPPNLGQLSALAMQAAPAAVGAVRPAVAPDGQPASGAAPGQEMQSAPAGDAAAQAAADKPAPAPVSTTGRSRGRSAVMGTDEWTRQRKDNHKEVERRRRGNINEGINELGRIVPNGTGEKAKGAILARAVQYIHHLKDNEARNIEKWTLEKLLMDQAMGDLQAQLEEVKRLWEEERLARQRLESELEVLRGMHGAGSAGSAALAPAAPSSKPPSSASKGPAAADEAAAAPNSPSPSNKRKNEGETTQDGESNERGEKKARTE